jgi:hypothetical protein
MCVSCNDVGTGENKQRTPPVYEPHTPNLPNIAPNPLQILYGSHNLETIYICTIKAPIEFGQVVLTVLRWRTFWQPCFWCIRQLFSSFFSDGKSSKNNITLLRPHVSFRESQSSHTSIPFIQSTEIVCVGYVVILSLFDTGINFKYPNLVQSNLFEMNRLQTYRHGWFFTKFSPFMSKNLELRSKTNCNLSQN